MVNPLLFPPVLIKRALEDLADIATAVRRLEPALTSRLDRLQAELDALREDILPIQQLAEVRKGIEPLDEDLDEVRKSIERIEPLAGEINARVERIAGQIGTMSGDLAPVGELAEKMPGVGRR